MENENRIDIKFKKLTFNKVHESENDIMKKERPIRRLIRVVLRMSVIIFIKNPFNLRIKNMVLRCFVWISSQKPTRSLIENHLIHCGRRRAKNID